MRLLLLAATGGAIGSAVRHLVNVGFGRWLGPQFPWATLFVNVTGCLAMGLLIEIIALRMNASLDMRTFIATGILGGYTTMSALSIDFAVLYERGDAILAALYLTASIVLSIAAVFAGLAFARAVLT